ncbi:hypothetical protein ES705_44574 [subsurface metagenome]
MGRDESPFLGSGRRLVSQLTLGNDRAALSRPSVSALQFPRMKRSLVPLPCRAAFGIALAARLGRQSEPPLPSRRYGMSAGGWCRPLILTTAKPDSVPDRHAPTRGRTSAPGPEDLHVHRLLTLRGH